MKKYCIYFVLLLSSFQTLAQQSENKIFVEVSPFQAAFRVLSISGGYEFKNWAVGAGFNVANHQFSHLLTKTTFDNYGDLHFVHTSGGELFVKRFFNNERKGLNIIATANITRWDVENHDEHITESVVGYYGTLSVGYRWFVLKSKIYLEPMLGASYNVSDKGTRKAGSQTYAFNKSGFEFTPEVKLGFRFNAK